MQAINIFMNSLFKMIPFLKKNELAESESMYTLLIVVTAYVRLTIEIMK